ncbi:MAG TPA: SDR family NAD(P)-dependent oxidoreductase [Alphaproteobacteria bacterium]|jgi:NAD(P)-dependent dehydrogenase (short-subunit alcohol dehydrogenase family)|nr:SDR family NAD(P)-dependent oxidoreductase [Alphaproteobacteria bacterium]
MEISLSGKVALVTGAGAGIGRAVAEALGGIGAKIAVMEIDPAKIEPTRAALAGAGIDALVLKADVTKAAEVNTAMAEIGKRFGRLDVLVNNVGHHLGSFKTLEQMEEADIDALYDINLKHLFIVTKAAIPLMRKSGPGGSIINVSSIEGFRGSPYNIAYTAFKHGVTGFTRGLAIELANDGIRVNTVAPETTDTEQVPLSLYIRPGFEDAAKRTIPLGRFGVPNDSAGAAIYLATDLSAWVTGTTIHVDGGGLAAAGLQRTPGGAWTVAPVVTESAMGS